LDHPEFHGDRSPWDSGWSSHRKPPKHPTGLEWRAKLRQQDQQDAAIFLTAAYAGLRLGELRSLCWRDLDFGKRLIHVRHSYVMRNETRRSPAASVASQ
jgi:integrase